MADSTPKDGIREFRCIHCNGKIHVPWDLPPTTGPCPHCGQEITSPAPSSFEDAPKSQTPEPPEEELPKEEELVVPDPLEVEDAPEEEPVSEDKPEEMPAGLKEVEPPVEDEVTLLAAEKVEKTDQALVDPIFGEPISSDSPVPPPPPVKVSSALEDEFPEDLEEIAAVEEPLVEAPVEPSSSEAVPEPVVSAEPVEDKPEPTPELASIPEDPSSPAQEEAAELEESFKGKDKGRANHRGKKRFPLVPLIVLLVLGALAAGVAFMAPKILAGREDASPPVPMAVNQEARKKQYLEHGWEKDARDVLAKFLAAETSTAKAAYSLRGSELLPEMERFYEGLAIDDSDTPAVAFSVFPLSMEDRERGIFMLTYDQPPVFEMSEFFVPLSPLAVQHKVREPDLLLATVARRNNFTAPPLKVNVLYKVTPDGLRIDWETFVQTKYRTLRDFLELPIAGNTRTFRVIIAETVPENRIVPAGHRTYLVADPAYHREDSARVSVPVDSDIGRALSILNWRGTKDSRALSKTATIQLRWSDEEEPQLELSKFICWEFLGIGGEALPSAE